MYTTHFNLNHPTFSIPHFWQTLPKHTFISFLSIFESIYFYMYKYFTWVYVCATHACLLPKEDRTWYWSPGTGVTYGPEMSFMWQNLNLGPLLNITYSVCIMLFVHIFSELSIWYALAWGNYHSCSQYSSVSYSSLHRIVALWDFPPFTLGCQLIPLLLACVWIAMLVRLYGCSLWYYLEKQSHSKPPILWLLHWFLIIFLNVP